MRRINAIVASCWIYFTIKHDARNHKYTVFVSVSQYVFSIGGMWLVSSDISGMFSVSDGYGSACLSYVQFIACPACEFIYATFVVVQVVVILAIYFSVCGLLCHGVCGSVCYV